MLHKDGNLESVPGVPGGGVEFGVNPEFTSVPLKTTLLWRRQLFKICSTTTTFWSPYQGLPGGSSKFGVIPDFASVTPEATLFWTMEQLLLRKEGNLESGNVEFGVNPEFASVTNEATFFWRAEKLLRNKEGNLGHQAGVHIMKKQRLR